MSKPRSAHLLGSSRLTILSLSLHVYLDTTGFFVSLSVLSLSLFLHGICPDRPTPVRHSGHVYDHLEGIHYPPS
jgi:hypothetical protein